MTTTITTPRWTEHGMQAGDIVTIPTSLSQWQRFLIWVTAPGFYWPARTLSGTYTVVEVSNKHSFEIERT